MSNPSRLNKAMTALMLLLFVVYCSVGVCTSLLNSFSQSDMGQDQFAHAHHQMTETAGSTESLSHCGDSESCEWSRNLVAEPVLDAPADFFFAYLLAAVSLICLLALMLSRSRGLYAFARENCFQYTYPRIHLQQAVFLN